MLSGYWLTRLFPDAGLPDGVLNVVHGDRVPALRGVVVGRLGRALRQRRQAQQNAEDQHEEDLCEPHDAKTSGSSRGTRSSHAGTGNPFSFRKAGLNSLDW